MKAALVLLALVPIVLAAPQKRVFLDTLGLDLNQIKVTVQHLADTLGTDATEQQCEAVCHGFVRGDDGSLLHTFCTPVCRSLQSLIHMFHIAPSTTTATQKRLILDTLGIDISGIKDTVQHVVDTLGTDATEQQCETVCHGFVRGDETALLHTFCTPICRSVQELAHRFHIAPSTTQKRMILDTLGIDLDGIKATVQHLVDNLGTDATEQQCEAVCHGFVRGDETALIHTFCSPVCRSIQELTHHFHIAPSTTQKRFILDTFGVDIDGIKATVQHVVDTLGTDATEQQCEAVCHGFVRGDETALLHTFCTPICRSVQQLAGHFHIAPSTVKRALIGDLVNLDVVKQAVGKLVDTLGTDITEQQCETGCHAMVLADETALVHTLCNPICRSFQALVHHFHPAKRMFLDDFLDLGVVRDAVSKLAGTLGTDATEQQCETGCHTLVLGEETALAHTFCTPICRSLQQLVHHFNIQPTKAPAKRLFLDTLGLDLDAIKLTVQHLLDTIGTDDNEQQCESACHSFVLGEEGALLHTFCTPVCRSFQSLVHMFHLAPSTSSQSTAPPA